MEKLIELLNEFETPRSGVVFKSYDDYDGTFYGVDIDGETEIAWSDSFICGKRFGWVKWLVENDKIDFVKTIKNIKGFPFDANYRTRNKYECILMTLAIQDNPIEFLISILN